MGWETGFSLGVGVGVLLECGGGGTTFSTAELCASSRSPTTDGRRLMDQAVRTLVDAGFEKEDATAALKRSGGDADEAILLLLGDELTPARVLRHRHAVPDWGGSLPQEVLEVLGRWLNQHLGAFDGRPRLKPVPEYLHPLAINRYRATHSIKEIESGRTRLVATREMLLALRACRQSCRVWRDEISYRGVTELALDGVLHIGRLSPMKDIYGLPSLEQMARDASHANSRTCPPNVYTWWPGHRTLQDPARNICRGPASRCPACRTPRPRTQNVGKYPTLKQFMKDMGIGNWFGAVTELLGITSVAALRQMTTYELMQLSRKHNYSETQMLEVAPKVIAKVGAGSDWESRKTSEGTWSRTNGQKFAERTHCEDCGLGCLPQWMPPPCLPRGTEPGEGSRNTSTICETCGFVYCSDCADGIFSDSRPQTVDAILPSDFSERFSNLSMLSLCDLELPYLPAMLAKCTSLTSLNASGNCLRSLGTQTDTRAAAEDDQSARMASLDPINDDLPVLVDDDDLMIIDEDDQSLNGDDLSQCTVLPPGLLELDLSGRSQWMDNGSAAATNCAGRRQQKWQRQLSLSVGSLPKSLRDLRLSNLGLQRVPIALRACTELRTLDLSYNNFAIRRDWTGLLPAAEGGIPGGSPWERGDLSAEVWLGELRFLGGLNLCDAATVISQGGHGPGGQLTPAQIAAATAYFTQRAQLIQQRQQVRNALRQASATLRSNRVQEHTAFKDFEAACAQVARCKALLSRCDPGDTERWARMDAKRAAAEAEEVIAAARKTHASAEHAAAEAAHTAATQAHQTVLATVANLGPPPVALGAWQAHNQDNLAQLIREGTRLTEQVLETLSEEHWLRKWSGQLQLVESHED